MHILYNTTTGVIRLSSTGAIQQTLEGHALAEVNDTNFDPELVIYNASTGLLEDKHNKLEVLAQSAINQLRHHRNAKLAQTDWTQLPDVSLTQQQKDQWASYRQALRDMPDSFPDPMPPGYRPTWPQKP